MQQVYYDTGNAVVEFGHDPRPQIMIVKKAQQTAQKYLKTIQDRAAGVMTLAWGLAVAK